MKPAMRYLLVALTFVLTANCARAQVSGGVDLVSRYDDWRGWTISDAPAIQPVVESSLGNLTLGAWGSFVIFDRGTFGQYDELNLMVDYTREILDRLSLSAGFILYVFPNQGPFRPKDHLSPEVYVGASSDVPLNPQVYLYYDTNLADGLYAEAVLEPEFSVGGRTYAIKGSVGHNTSQFGLHQFSHVGAELSTGFSIGPATVTPHGGIMYSHIEKSTRGLFGILVEVD